MPLRVMIVDDSRAMRRIEKDVVLQLGDIEVIEAEDGVSAIYRMRDNRFEIDLILLDWMMPRIDGITLAKRLKSHPTLSKIPVLMVTSMTDEQRIREARLIGVDGYLLKPFTKEMLLRAIVALAPGEWKLEHAAAGAVEMGLSAANTFFDQLPPNLRSKIDDAADILQIGPKTLILSEGKPVVHFYFVDSGKVQELRQSPGPGGSIGHEYGPGDCFGVTELMTGDVLGANHVTSKESRIGILQKTDFETLLLNHPEISIVLSRYLAEKSRKMDAEPGESNALSGALEILELPDLIQALNLRQKTGFIELPEIDSRIELSAGQVMAVYHPDCPPEDGRLSFLKIVEQKPRSFKFHQKELSGERNVLVNTTELLLECMRQIDERRK